MYILIACFFNMKIDYHFGLLSQKIFDTEEFLKFI